MSEVAQPIHEKTGLSEEESAQLAHTIFGLIQSKLPAEVQGYVAPFLNGEEGAATGQSEAQGGELGSLLGAASGFFGHQG